jgi:hypothetical protein
MVVCRHVSYPGTHLTQGEQRRRQRARSKRPAYSARCCKLGKDTYKLGKDTGAPFGAWKVLLIVRGKGGEESMLQGIRLPARSFVCLVFVRTDRHNILAVTLAFVVFTSYCHTCDQKSGLCLPVGSSRNAVSAAGLLNRWLVKNAAYTAHVTVRLVTRSSQRWRQERHQSSG